MYVFGVIYNLAFCHSPVPFLWKDCVMGNTREDALWRKTAKKTIAKKTIVIVALVLVAVTVVAFCVWRGSSKQATFEYLQSKLSPVPVSNVFHPVAILRYGNQDVCKVNGVDTIYPRLAGVGTMFKAIDGKHYVITAEHLFTVHKPINDIRKKCAVKLFRDNSSSVGAIVKASPFFPQKPGLVDTAICVVGQDPNVEIEPFSQFYGADRPQQVTITSLQYAGKPEDESLQSLVTGEMTPSFYKGEIVGAEGAFLYCIGFAGLDGESGTGFIDKRGNLYVYVASLSSKDVSDMNADFKERGIISRDRRSYGIAVGPFKLETK